MSSNLNSLGATLFEDFVRPYIKKGVSDATISNILKCVVVIIGGACLLLVFIVDKLGSILQVGTMNIFNKLSENNCINKFSSLIYFHNESTQ